MAIRTVEANIGPVFRRDFFLDNVCDVFEGHEHAYDHTMVVIRGRVKIAYSYLHNGVLVQGETIEYGQGDEIVVYANTRHTVKALEDNTWYKCFFSHRTFGGIVSQTSTGNVAAYK